MPIPLQVPIVDPDKCIGCGACVGISPAVFEMQGDGQAKAKDGSGDSPENILAAISGCPTGAISLIKSKQDLPSRS